MITRQNLVLSLALSAVLTPGLHAITISFESSIWNSGATGEVKTTQTGYVESVPGTGNKGTSGTATEGGVTVTFTATFVGSSTRAGVPISFANATGTANPNGFIFGSTDNNSSTLTLDDNLKTIKGAIVNYQRWDFQFSTPVILDAFVIEDVDSLTSGFRDIVAAEAFSTFLPGTAGTGIDAIYSLGTNLYASNEPTIGGQLLYAAAALYNLNNPNNTPEVRLGVDFGAQALSSFSLYTFSDKTQVHRTSISGSSFQISVAPEPSTALLAALPLLGLMRRRR